MDAKNDPRWLVVMGVSGSGKTTLGNELAEIMGLDYRDGDDLHPQANIDKMAAGDPLTDEDRWPWLRLVGQWLADQEDGGIIGCSALKRVYRDVLREACPQVQFVHVHGDFDVLFERMGLRPGHFMPASLLQSQFDTLEPLEDDETGRVFDVTRPAREIARDVAAWLDETGSSPKHEHTSETDKTD